MVGAYLAVLSQVVLLGHALPGERQERVRSSPSWVGLRQRAAGTSVAPTLLRDDTCLDGRIVRWSWWVSAGQGRGWKEYGVRVQLCSWVINESALIPSSENHRLARKRFAPASRGTLEI